jgi:chlorite dismutase
MADNIAPSTYAVFWLYRLDPLWRRLPPTDQRHATDEFVATLAARDPCVTLRGAYSLVGLRNDADLLLWVHGTDLDSMQRLAVDLNHTGLGAYLSSAYTYVGVVTGARYDPDHKPSFLRGIAPLNYLSMYPFTKTADWYLLPYDQRRELMAEHGRLGRRYTDPVAHGRGGARAATGGGATAAATAVAPAEAGTGGGVLTNTVDAFGLGDYEFVVAFESNDPAELCRMVEDLRSVEVRRYTKADTPIFLGRRREPAEVLADL